MTRWAWSPAAPELSVPALICRSPTARKKSAPAARFASSRSFDVLDLFTQFFDLRFDFQRQPSNGQCFALHARRLRKHGVGFAMHFLQQEIQFFAEFPRAVEQLRELLQVAPQAVELFADVAAFGEQRRFLRQPT